MTTEFDQQVAEAVYDSALKVIKKTAPHFIPLTYECDSLVNGRLSDHYIWVNPKFNDDGLLRKSMSFAQGYRYGRVQFYLDHLDDDLVADDVMIVIIGIVPMNESVAPDWDENTPESVRKTDTRPVIVAHRFFQSELE